ncbi:MAG: ATP-binding protein [Acidimicrobiia bacterium]|nr:ATP-binding protein [Acidimicrobiia bacterium]
MNAALALGVILLAGLLLGGIARLLLPGDEELSLSATTLIGIAGSAVGSLLVSLLTGEWTFTEVSPALIIGALAGSVIVLAAVIVVRQRFFVSTADRPIADLLAGGEGPDVEFKSTARVNLHTGVRDDRMEAAVVKTIAGFLNADGGWLLVGVDDQGAPLGLDADLATMKQADHDRYELWLTDHLGRTIGTPALAFISVSFVPVGAHHVVVVRVEPADDPVFVDTPRGERTADFYVRVGNSTRQLLTDEFETYRRTRWR